MDDRRTLRTRRAVFSALEELLSDRDYDKITVRDIIEKADIGRSTFYGHFETKDMLFDAFCQNICKHAFEPEHSTIRDARPMPSGNFRNRLIHVLMHLSDPALGIAHILRSGGRDAFRKYLSKSLAPVFEETLPKRGNVPESYTLAIALAAFVTTLDWWLIDHPNLPAENVADAFLNIFENGNRAT